ncbi:MAG: hypothetical protein R2845_02695 [Thermomicrobiales bacterium]
MRGSILRTQSIASPRTPGTGGPEGIGFSLLDAWQVVQEVTASRPERIVLAGGGARRRLAADHCRSIRPAGGDAAIRRALRHRRCDARRRLAGAEIDDLVHRWVRYAPPIDPRPEIHERYRSLHTIYQTAYESSASVNALLAKWRPAGSDDRISRVTGSKPKAA